jgi:RNA-directed DNA polymerase
MTPLCGDTSLKTDLSNWADINWHKVKREVKRLRGRIFAAKSKKEFRKLRSLQGLMLKFSSNILLSIRHVTNNSGSKSTGHDKISINTPKARFEEFLFI